MKLARIPSIWSRSQKAFDMNMLARAHSLDVSRKAGEYDVFIGSPMSPFSSAEYHANRESLIALASGLKKVFGFSRIFCPGISVESKKSFSTEYDSIGEDLAALRSSSCFVLHYINAVKSSALFEAGIAYAHAVPSVYIVKKKSDLPYMLRELGTYEQHVHGDRALVKVVELGQVEFASHIVQDNWFPALHIHQ